MASVRIILDVEVEKGDAGKVAQWANEPTQMKRLAGFFNHTMVPAMEEENFTLKAAGGGAHVHVRTDDPCGEVYGKQVFQPFDE